MRTLSYYLGVSKQYEVLVLVLIGICCTIFDASLFNLQTNLYKVWNAPLDPSKFTDTAQLYVKYILSSIVLVRTFTVHLYLAFYIVMLWPAIFEEKAGLLIPWLTVGAVKCLAMGAMSFSTGLYICLTYRFSKAACWDFLITQIIDQGPSIYMWFCVLSYYYDLKRKVPEIIYHPVRQTSSTVFSLMERRRRVKGLFHGAKFDNTFDDNRQLISASTIDNIINQLNINLNRDTTRSLDSLLTRMTAEAEKEEIFDTKDENSEEEKDASYAERALKVLNVTASYVDTAKSKRSSHEKNPVSSNKEKRGKVKSDLLLLVKKSLPDFRKKHKKFSEKLATKKSGDELSHILSESELSSVDDINDKTSTDEQQTALIQNEENLANVETDTAIKDAIAEGSKRKHSSVEMEEILIKKVDILDDISDVSVENKDFVEVPESKINVEEDVSRKSSEKDSIKGSKSSKVSFELRQKGSKIPCKISSSKTSSHGSKELPIKDDNVPEKLKIVEKTRTSTWSSTKNSASTTRNLKSRSHVSSNNLAMSTPTFKYDGYTLAYIESLKRKAATDLMKNTRRPSTSGT